MRKFLIVGLGNPGEKYQETRHNIGFKILDALAESSSIFFTSDRYADRAEYRIKGRTLVLIKPTTFMNLSGKAVNYWMQKEKVPIENLLVITDDLAIPFGTVRIKKKGSDGGHNGLKDIQATLGHPNYPRLRFGVGNEFPRGKQVDYVLGEWSTEENQALKERLELCKNAVESFALMGINEAMNRFNNK